MWQPAVRGPYSRTRQRGGKKSIKHRSVRPPTFHFTSTASIDLLNSLCNYVLTRLYMSIPQPDSQYSQQQPGHPDTQSIHHTEQNTAPFDPALFGHPHDEAESQDTEPFWHQYPYWSQPGNQLYYYPELQSFFNHPLYISYDMDDKPIIIGYGKNSQFAKKSAHGRTAPKSRYVEMVEVYVADEYIQQVPKKLLLRFSSVAKNEFGLRPAQVESGLPSERHDSLSVEGRTGEGSKLDCVDDVNGSGKGTPKSPPTKDPVASGSGSKSKGLQSPEGTQPDGKNHSKPRLDLKIDCIEAHNMPSVKTVKAAITWMQDNAGEKEYDKILDYAPRALGDVSFLTLIDFYQAALAFGLQPFGKVQRLRNEILDRLTGMKMDLVTLETVAQFVPVWDSVTARAITRAHECWGEYQYDANEWLEIKEFLLQNPNTALQRKARGIIFSRQKAFAQEKRSHQEAQDNHRREHAEASRQQDWQSVSRSSNEPVAEVAAETGSARAESQTTDASGGRRRNRRGHQRRGQGLNGREVPGARYD